MTVNLIIPIQCDEYTCNSSAFRACKFIARNPGAPSNYYCLLFSVELLGDYNIDDVACSYKELRRCKECKEAHWRK